MKKQTHSIFWLLSCVRARIPSLLALLLLSMANAELGVLFALGTRGVVNAAASGEAAALLRASGVQAALIAALLTVAVSCAMFAFSPWAALIAFCACAALCATFAVFTARRYRRIAELSESLDRILHGADSVEIRDAAEGELSILSSEVRKMTVRLREQADYLSRDRAC